MPYTSVATVADGDDILATWGNSVSALAGEVQVFIPPETTTWSNPIASGITVGNGTTAASYSKTGPWITAYFKFTLGSTSAITGAVLLTLPVNSIVQRFIGSAYFFDSSAPASFQGAVRQDLSNSSASILALSDAASPNIGYAGLSSTVPFTWATSDIIVVGPFSYRWV